MVPYAEPLVPSTANRETDRKEGDKSVMAFLTRLQVYAFYSVGRLILLSLLSCPLLIRVIID